MSDDIQLPELPEPDRLSWHSTDALQSYARAAVLADRERRAQPAPGQPSAEPVGHFVNTAPSGARPRWEQLHDSHKEDADAVPLYTHPSPADEAVRMRELLVMARDRLESDRKSGEFDPLIRDIDAALAAQQQENDNE